MDLIKQELLKKRQGLSEATSSRKVFKQIQKLQEEEKREAEAKRLRQNQIQNDSKPLDPNTSNPNSNIDSSQSKPESVVSSSKAPITDEQKIDSLKLPKQEVIRRLLFLKQLVMFGGSDDDRLRFLKQPVMFLGLFFHISLEFWLN
ncbi:putative pre-mRNA-splicing factor 18 [Helianthus annuus]|nr:putative pre-mRNA-splicing factor 18 [Helianthus annuus]